MLSNGTKWGIGLRTPKPPVGGSSPPTPARLSKQIGIKTGRLEMAQAKLKAAFIFWANDADPAKHRTTISLNSLELIVVGVRDYDQAAKVSQALVKEGVVAIELCGGFGNIGVARVAEAVKGVRVGVVKFDMHPILQDKSGDQIFGLTP